MILSDFCSRVAKAIGVDDEPETDKSLEFVSEIKTWSIMMLHDIKRC